MTYVTVSKERRDELAGLLACPPEEIRVVYNGVDPRTLLRLSPEGQELIESLELLTQDLVILMPVRVTRAKNIEFALRLVAALKDQGQRLKLVLTGPPDPHDADSMDYFQELQSLRKDLGVEEEMRFVFESGPHPDESHTVDMEVVADLFRVCDLVLMPSHQEGFGMPVLEAGLSGVPVVCTDVPAAVEIGGDDVMLIDAGSDPSQVADRISNEIQTRPVQSLRRRVRQRYTWSAIFQEDIRPLVTDAQS
jgi:glycosyltransferase involved in cell wall biosynthesis